VKRLITIFLTAVILILPAQALADAKGPLSYDRAVSLLKLNNTTLKKLQRAEEDADKAYKSNLLDAGNIDVNGFTMSYGGKDYYINYDATTRLAMTKMKELMPEQMKFSWEAAKSQRLITENSLETALRNVFLGVYSARNDLELKQKQLSLASEQNKQNALKLEKGLITPLDMEESEYELFKAQKAVDIANRTFNNAVRSFNQFANQPSKTEYTQIVYEEVLSRPELKPVDFFVEAALKNRFDIISIQKQLALKEQDKTLTDTGFTHKIDTNDQQSYERLLNDIEQLNVDLEAKKLEIDKEIRNAYVEVVIAGKKLDNMYNTVKLQRNNYEKMQARYKAGLISKNVLAQTELGLLQVENGYKTMLFDYNTKITRFNNATGIGPGY
jgi:outer membrane protein TolC